MPAGACRPRPRSPAGERRSPASSLALHEPSVLLAAQPQALELRRLVLARPDERVGGVLPPALAALVLVQQRVSVGAHAPLTGRRRPGGPSACLRAHGAGATGGRA